MIAYSEDQLALMASAHYNVYLQVLIEKIATGEFYNFFDYGEPTKRIIGATVNASIDLATIEGAVTFQRGLGSESLSPLMNASTYNATMPLLWPGNKLYLYVAVVAPGVTPTGSDFSIILSGRIDNVDLVGTDEVRVRFRDFGAYLLNRFIQTPVVYGSTAGVPVEAVIDQIVAAWPADAGTAGPVGVVKPGSAAGFMVQPYTQERMPVLEALRRLAMQIGWELRYYPRFGPVVVFQDPDRARAVQATIGPSMYLQVNRLELSDDDVRNRWKVGYPPAVGEPKTLFVQVEDAASQLQHGIRFAEVVFDRSANINSAIEATGYANIALADTKDPLADFAVELLAFPAVELNDLYLFPANDVHLDTDQEWAIAGYQHTFSRGSGRTTLFTRGKPIAYYRDYRRGVQPRVYVGSSPPPDDFDPADGAIWIVRPAT